MIQDRHYILQRLNILTDAACAILALIVAYMTRTALAYAYQMTAHLLPAWFPEIVPYEEMHLFQEYIWLFPVCAMLWPAALNRWGYYDLYDLRGTAARRWIVIKASIFSTIVLVTLIFVFKTQFIARIVIIGTSIWSAIFLVIKDTVMRTILLRMHTRPEYQYRVLLIAQKEKKEQAESLIYSYKEWGVRICNSRDLDDIDIDSFPALLTAEPVDEIVFSVTPSAYATLPPLIDICEKLGIRTRILMDIYRPDICELKAETLYNIPMLALNPTTHNVGALTVKIYADRVLALLLLIILSPLFLLIACIIAVTSRGSVIYRQVRCGFNARPFTLYKFRSMIENAEIMQEELAKANEVKGWAFKMKNDPRVTRVGTLLRRFSLDELPQLWNVLRGEMSLVGPRPVLPDEVEKFQLWERRRFSMKPGMTGLWQVAGRTKIPNEKWVEYDLDYIDNWSLKRDVLILLKTCWVVLCGKGE